MSRNSKNTPPPGIVNLSQIWLIWTCGAHSLIPDKSMDYREANCLLGVEFWYW